MCISDAQPTAPVTQTSISNEEIERLEHRIAELEKQIANGATAKPQKTVAKKPTAPIIPREKIDYNKAKLLDSWPDIVEKIKDKSMMLATVLSTSQAYVLDDLLLLDVENPDFAQMINSEQRHRDAIKECAKEITGDTYCLAPYKRKKTAVSNSNDKMDILLKENSDIVSDM